MTGPLLFGGIPSEAFFLQPDALVAFGMLGGALLVGALAVHLIDRWRKRDAKAEHTPDEDLTNFRAMFERGELTEAEYDKVRKRAAERMKQKLGVAPPAAAPTLPPEPPAPEAG